MRVRLAEEIMEKLGMEKTSDNYQKIYKIADSILKDANDYFVLETAIERGLVETPKCKTCGRKTERIYSYNGVFDGEHCPKEDFSGKHE